MLWPVPVTLLSVTTVATAFWATVEVVLLLLLAVMTGAVLMRGAGAFNAGGALLNCVAYD